MVKYTSSILIDAIEKYKPSSIWALFSGGSDSLVVTHLVSKLYPDFKVAHINTGIGIRQTREFVIETCKRYNWPLTIFETPEKYENLIAKWGFPGPKIHNRMYNCLKDRCIEVLVRRNKRECFFLDEEYNLIKRDKHFDRILLVTGIRQDESRKRMGYTNPINRRGAQVWCNAIFDWSSEKKEQYIADNNLEINPVTKILGYSGECLCGAYAIGRNGKAERHLIDTFFPEAAEELRRLENIASQNGHFWKWHEMPPKYLKEIKDGQTFMPMCFNCLIKGDSNG